MMEATVNDKNSYQVAVASEGVDVDGQTYVPDIHQYGERLFHSIHRQTGHVIELLEADYARKYFVFKVQGKRMTVQLKDELDLLVEKMGMAQATETLIKEVNAPMPGLIVGLAVEAGQEIRQGDSLLTLEAMKMENVLKSPVDGVVETLHVQAGDSVDKNQLLITFTNE